MALLDIFLPNLASDVVAIFDSNFNQVVARALPIKAVVKKTAKIMEHPVETGAVITDHKIINPVEIELSMVLNSADYRSVYDQFNNLFIRSELLTVQTKASTYNQMIISDMPHEEDAAMFDALSLGLKLKEVQFVSAQYGTLQPKQVENPADASTKQVGEKQSIEATIDQTARAEAVYTSNLTGFSL